MPWLLLRRQRAVQQQCLDALIAQLLDLIFHQRNQLAHDDRQSPSQDRRQMIAQALASAGGHDAQHITTAHHILDHFALRRAKLVQAKVCLKLIPKIGHAAGL